MFISSQLAQIAYTDSVQKLVVGFIFLALTCLALIVGLYAWWKHHKHPHEETWFLSGLVSALLGVFCLIISLVFLANVWTWVGINHPALLAAKQQIAAAHRPRPLL